MPKDISSYFLEKGEPTSLTDYVDINAELSKGQEMDLINARARLNIPITEKLKLVDDITYGKVKIPEFNFTQADFDQNIGLEYNTDGEGLSGGIRYNTATEQPEGFLKFRKTFSEGSDFNRNPTGKNQWGTPRTLEEVQASIDSAPMIEKKGKLVERAPKDLYKESKYTKTNKNEIRYITRPEYDKYKKELKFKTTRKPVLQDPNKSNITRSNKIKATQGSNISLLGQGQKGVQFSHVYPLIESAPPGTKTTGPIDASMNRYLENYNRIGQSIAEQQEELIRTKPEGYKRQIEILNGKAKKNVLNAIEELGPEYKGQIGYFQVDPDSGEFKPKAGNYKMSFAGLEGESKIYKNMSGTERKAFEKEISKAAKYGKYAKQIAKPFLRLAAPIIPFAGPAIMGLGAYDVAKSAEMGYTSPDELALAYNLGPEAAAGIASLKNKIRGQRDETETFIP